MTRSQGFSLIEAVIAIGLTTTVVASVFAVLQPAQGAFDAVLEASDMQQRLRVAADTLTRDLTMAGAGAYAAGHAGPLMHYVAPVLPFRKGLSGAAAVGTFRSDTITLLSVPSTAAQATLAADLLPADLTLQAEAAPGCPAAPALCGFTSGMTVLVYDETGNVGLFALAAVDAAAAQLTLTTRPADSAAATFRRGSNVVEARVDVYYLKADIASQTFQLMHYDGSANADVPVADHVVGLAFEFFGEPRPPGSPAAGGPSYGPAPPQLGAAPTGYPAGENCTFRLDESGAQVPRLPALDATAGFTRLAPAIFVDGPWCPDEASANRWDADLLRIRKVGVTIRVEAGASALRGPAGVLFANAGSSRRANAWLPDQEIRFLVSPRNLNLERE